MGDSVAEYRSRPTLRPDPRQCSIPVSLRSSIVSHSYTKLKSRIRACEPQLGWLQWLLMYTLCLFESQPPPSHIYIVIGITADWHDDFREVVRQPGSGMLHIQGKRTFLLASMSDLIELLRWLRKDQKYVGFFHVLIAVEGPCRLDWPTIGYDMGLIRFYGCQDSEGKELVHLYTQSNQADVADIFHDICIKPIVELPDPPLVDSPTEPVQPLAFHVHKHVHMAPAYPASSPESSPPAGGIFESLAAAEETSAPRPKLSSLSSIAAHGRSRRAESFAVASGLLDAKGPTRRASPVVASSSTRTASPEHGELHGARQNTDDEERFYPRIDATIRHLDQRKDNYSAPLKVFIVDTGASKEAPRGTSKCARRVRAAWKHLSRIDSATTKKVHLKSDRAKDRIGHGTNVAALFHKYGPSAEVWVCKVVEDIPDDKDGGYQYTIDPKAVADVGIDSLFVCGLADRSRRCNQLMSMMRTSSSCLWDSRTNSNLSKTPCEQSKRETITSTGIPTSSPRHQTTGSLPDLFPGLHGGLGCMEYQLPACTASHTTRLLFLDPQRCPRSISATVHRYSSSEPTAYLSMKRVELRLGLLPYLLDWLQRFCILHGVMHQTTLGNWPKLYMSMSRLLDWTPSSVQNLKNPTRGGTSSCCSMRYSKDNRILLGTAGSTRSILCSKTFTTFTSHSCTTRAVDPE
jgi:hypothetical protein